MPRSFLVKKHFNAAKKPNYGELDTHAGTAAPPCLCDGLALPALAPPEALGARAGRPLAAWTAAAPGRAPLPPGGLSPLSGFAPGLGRASPAPPSDASSREHSGSEGAASDGEERPGGAAGAGGAPGRLQCRRCGRAYASFAGLARHRQLHCDAQPRRAFSCKYCDKEYVSLGALKMHIRTHTLPCVCKMCGKAFSRPWLLQGHIRTHTGEKPFSCPHCNRAFADRSNLRAHLQTHSDVKKYQCKNCSKTFSRMSLLHKHEESGCCVAH